MQSWSGDVERSPSRNWALLIVGLIAAVVVGVSFIEGNRETSSPQISGTETSSAPATAPSTTQQRATLSQTTVEWRRVSTFVNSRPIEMLQADGMVHLFAAHGDSPSTIDGGLDHWTSSDDGVTWTEVGTVIAEPHLVQGVATTTAGFIAGGIDGVTSGPAIWLGSEAGTWSLTSLSEPVDTLPRIVSRVHVAGSGDVLAVAVEASVDLGSAIRTIAPAELRTDDAFADFQVTWDADPLVVRLEGPLGLVAFETSGTELGFTDAQIERALVAPTRTTAHVSFDGGLSWTVSDTALRTTSAIAVSDEGVVVIAGDTDEGPATIRSNDGREWAPTLHNRRLTEIVNTGDRFLAIKPGVVEPELIASRLGAQWGRLRLGRVLPGQAAVLREVASHGTIIALLALTPTVAVGPDPPPAQLLIERDGVQIRRNPGTGVLEVVYNGDVIELISPRLGGRSRLVSLDPTARTATITADSGVELVTFTFDELLVAGSSGVEAFGVELEEHVLVSVDETTWSQENSIAAFGRVTDGVLAVTDSAALVAFTVGGQPGSAFDVTLTEVWRASLVP